MFPDQFQVHVGEIQIHQFALARIQIIISVYAQLFGSTPFQLDARDVVVFQIEATAHVLNVQRVIGFFFVRPFEENRLPVRQQAVIHLGGVQAVHIVHQPPTHHLSLKARVTPGKPTFVASPEILVHFQ